jgi:lysozyme family protein
MTEFESLRAQYAAQWKSMAVLPQYREAVAEIATKLASHKTRYQSVERKIGVPWYMVAVIHERESGADFTAHLHNGDPSRHALIMFQPGGQKQEARHFRGKTAQSTR